MKIVSKKTEELKEYANNPRENDGAVQSVAESIKEFGFKVPIIIDRSGVIIAGHTRKKAAALLGIEEVPCIIADDLTPEQIQAFRLAENKTGELATWDFAALEKELESLTAFDVDMSRFGFDENIFDTDELPDEIELEREKNGTAVKSPQIKYGSTVIYLTEEEDEKFDQLLTDYLSENGTLYGFIASLLFEV